MNKKAEDRFNIVLEKKSKGLRNPDYLDYRYNLEKQRYVSANRVHKSDNNVIMSLKYDNPLMRK
jgi:hypothetical protein